MSWILLLTRKPGEAYAAQLVRLVMQRAQSELQKSGCKAVLRRTSGGRLLRVDYT
ncbi:hypothetical protein [Paenibacillus amylolyticus]|uniref:hypothetical protein n=1 Tax=Paenibacillus amylolyticus TaxID=1451 RepID=UPI0013752524|nr:hypothetical protein [Paenibacillus amylolyticus]